MEFVREKKIHVKSKIQVKGKINLHSQIKSVVIKVKEKKYFDNYTIEYC